MKFKPLTKKGQVSGLISGVGTLVILVVITLVIVITVLSANLFEDSRLSTEYENQSINASAAASFGNTTLWDSVCSVGTGPWNMTTGETIPATNYTLDTEACTILFFSTVGDPEGDYNGTVWGINSTTNYAGEVEQIPRNLQSNFTSGINEVSSKIPTILLIAAVIILLAVLGLLLRNTSAFNIGGKSSL